MRTLFIQVAYIGASVLFILGLRSLTRPDKARRGMQQAAVGMLLAIAGTLVNHQIIDYKWIALGMVIGIVVGYPLGMWVPMTAMPQRIALALSFSALAATLVGVAEYYTDLQGFEVNHGDVVAQTVRNIKLHSGLGLRPRQGDRSSQDQQRQYRPPSNCSRHPLP